MSVQGFKFALDPTPRQVGDLHRHAGAARVAFNWGSARIKANLSQRQAERSYGIGEDELTEAVGWSLYALRRDWNQAKHDAAPWWAECSKEAYNTGLDQLARGLKNFADSTKGRRKGPKAGFPRFKSKRRATPSVRFTTGVIRDAVIGVDLGVRHLAVLSDGTMIDNPRHYDAWQRKLARASRTVSRRRGPDRRTGQQASNRWKKANAARNRVHHRVTYQRADALHKLTTGLAREYGTIAVEDLNVADMKRNRRLARQIGDAAFGEIRRRLGYKTDWRGGTLAAADRWYPSSKTCSRCKTVKPKLSLKERVFVCEACGLVIDRDRNAAINLADLVDRHVAGSGPETENGRGAPCKTRPRLAGGDTPRRRTEASTPHPARAGIGRGLSPGNG